MGGVIPLRDASRQPASFPIVTTAIIAVNVLVFAQELMSGETFVRHWSLIPADFAAGRHWITILTAMFLHAGWMHILSNMVFLWAFGPALEDVMGGFRYLSFYLLSGLAASLLQIAAVRSSTVPNLGASGAIAGVMGAFWSPTLVIRYARYCCLAGCPHHSYSAALLIGLWFLIQLFSQIGAVADAQTAGVAYTAHVGGFIFGAFVARIFEGFGRPAEFGI